MPTFRRQIAGLLALLACAVMAPAQPARAPGAGPARPNVVLITIDTLRADHVGCYGYKQIETPTIDGLARDGIVFERAISQVPLTWPSHAAILTGTYPFQNGVQDFTGQPLAPRFRTVAQALKQQGYATGAVVSSFVLDRSWGLARGFDFYDDAFSGSAFIEKDLALVDRRADASVTRAVNWLRKTPRRPFFLWLHLYDPHSPYDPPEPYKTQYRERPYDGEIAFADHELGRLIAYLKQAGVYDRTAIVLLSDHGESLGEHGEREHGFFVYNSTVHVPLIVKPAAASGMRPGREMDLVETVSVPATILRFANVKDPALEKQVAAAGLFDSREDRQGAAYSETFYPFSSFGWSPLHGLQQGRYHFIDAPQPELYDVLADPEEKNNLAAGQGATSSVLKDLLQKRLGENPFQAEKGAGAGLNPDAADKLRALGYVAYRSPVSAEALAKGLPDPKQKLWEFNAVLEAADASRAGDFAKQESLLKQVAEKDPQMYLVPFMLGETALRQQKWEQAAQHLKRCLELNPDFDQAMSALANALTGLNQPEEARQWLDKALKANPQNYRAWFQKARLDARSDQAAALASYNKVLEIQPNFAPARRDVGMLYFAQKKYPQAVKELAKAAALGLEEARLYNFLGICYSQTGRLQPAIASYRKAIALDANLAEAHLNLGYAYQKMGRSKAAASEYARACSLESRFCSKEPAKP
jgi:arylsulfatase A-like enzyme/Flp pilus assembly protein TadD